MFSKEDISLAYDKLEPYLEEIELRNSVRRKYFQKLMNKSYDEIAILLKCHLIVEHYLDIYLVEELGLKELKNAKLNFYNKVNFYLKIKLFTLLNLELLN